MEEDTLKHLQKTERKKLQRIRFNNEIIMSDESNSQSRHASIPIVGFAVGNLCLKVCRDTHFISLDLSIFRDLEGVDH